jgi:ABC-type bacteriocin/lantibiotic exporter with double-glycine peptidase domain
MAGRGSQLRRIIRLFRPHRARLGVVLGLIVVSALLGALSPFLLREILDTAIPEKDTALLSALAGGMIAISIATGVLGVAQTLLSNRVGQGVCTSFAPRSTGTSSGSRSRSSRGRGRARCNHGSRTTSAVSRRS